MGILEIDNVTLAVEGKHILDDLSIDFWEGHVHAIVGPNGAGKSTLAFTIMGLEGYRDIDGDIRFEGDSITSLAVDERARRGITLAWQEPARYEGLSIQSFIRAGTPDADSDTIADVLEQVGLAPEEYMDRAVDETLSGGERKKIELASILAMRPRFVMLDEPDSGIDVASLEKIFEGIDLLRGYGATVVLITHSMTVMQQAEHAFLLCGGQLVDKGRMEKILPYFEQECIPCGHKNIPDGGRDNGNE
ncbi:MAG: ABC transporter ATP-binding protein [Thermoplasmatota archaeon]